MKTWTRCLMETANRYPDRIAVSDREGEMTYRELAESAGICGSHLLPALSGNDPVVLLMDKSARALACLYGVLFAGGFYVFVSPDQPIERIHRILDDLSPAALIYEAATKDLASELAFGGFLADERELREGVIRRKALEERLDRQESSDLLYAIYTSGSTGSPKGIVVSHGAVFRFIEGFTDRFSIGKEDRIGNQAPFDFDVSVKDIFSACMTGAHLVIIPRQLFAVPAELMDCLIEGRVTVLIWAVSAMCMLSGFGAFSYRIPKDLRLVMFSGEVMPPKQLRIWQENLPEVLFVNLYGPSEITCNCTSFEVDRLYKDGEKIPIGGPLPGRLVHLENERGDRIGQAGQVGEILVGGESLSEGYYRNPDLTAEKFISRGEEGRFYRTGDLAHWDGQGNLVFDGRSDFQIKHMGHRIELEEIEACMMRLEGLSRACCLFDESRGRIWGFYSGDLSVKDCKAGMRDLLPRYMIPNKLEKLDSFPLNKNGKIDKKHLRERAGIGD